MDRLIYTALTGLQRAQESQAVTAHNLANLSTPGFRREMASLSSAYLTPTCAASSARVQSGGESPHDLRAAGRVETTGNPLDVALDGGAWLAVLDDAGIARAHVVGHHTGALIAVELAAAHPSRVASIVLSGPVYCDEKGRETLRPHFVQWHVQPDGSHLVEKWTKFSKWTSPASLVQRLLLDLFRAGETSEAGHFALLVYRMEDRLPLVHCPGLLIFGSRDPFADRSIEPIFLKQLSPGRAIQLEMGVFGPNEQPDAFARAVLEFLGTLAAR